ncbi:MAG: TonB-dependent receptor [Gemmatimonadota bacterium]|nr:TonB-dependent receptor [Gemmatimonadota bacterium]
MTGFVVRRAARIVLRSALVFPALIAAAVPTLLVAQASGSGTLVGKVTAAGGTEAIQGAVVQVSGTPSGALTNGAGTYRIVIPAGRYEVRVRFIGFGMARDSVTISAGQTTTKDWALSASAVNLNEIVSTGTRRTDRTVLDAPAPIDVFTSEEVKLTGRVETAQILQTLAPSVNFPRPSVTDGTDHERPATLRGLDPDHVLVLINGKRRHTSALVNVNGSVGRGAAAVDLNAIPAEAIDHIEVLRDGAAAQYGSDAIAGVVNIILKSNAPAELVATTGKTSFGDGALVDGATNLSSTIFGEGFFNLTGEYRYREATNRSRADKRQQYFTGDPRNANPPFDLVNHRLGDAQTKDGLLWANAGRSLSNGLQLYGFGGLSYRAGDAAGFYRRAQDDRTVRAIYPNGFLPLIDSKIWDGSITGGVKGNVAGFAWDLSTAFGRNTFEFDINHTANVSYGAQSKTSFYAGTLGFNQWTNNLDLVQAFPVGFATPLNVAFGAEFRREGYSITAGEPQSYLDGGVKILDGPNAGKQPAIGSQVFPGFRPTDAVDASRTNFAGYLDLETNPIAQLTLGAAGRIEHYSDYSGTTSTGKLSARYELIPGYAVRGTLSSGFRAPSLPQTWFSSTATNFQLIGGVLTPVDSKTFPVTSPQAKILGAVPLKPEKSSNLSLGVTAEPFQNFSMSVDAYRIFITDRIALTGNFVGDSVRLRLANGGFPGVGGARYFTNAIDTRTEGLDVVANYGFSLPDASRLRLTGGYNRNYTRITRISATPPALSAQQETLFDRGERGRIERGQPGTNLHLAANWQKSDFGLNVNAVQYGKVSVYTASDATGASDQTFGAKWITDISGSYTFLRRYTATVGADNVFDVYPDENKPVLSNSGIFPYTGYSPFGYNGRYYYVRLAITR